LAVGRNASGYQDKTKYYGNNSSPSVSDSATLAAEGMAAVMANGANLISLMSTM